MAPNYDRRVKVLRKTHNKVIQLIQQHTGNVQRVLDIGTGTGNIALALAQAVEAVDAVDPSPQMLEVAESKAQDENIQNVTFSLQGAYHLDFPDHTFDMVVISHVLHIIERPEVALSEAKRVLKIGGTFIAPTYCHGQNLLARTFSFIMRNFLKQPVYHKFTGEDLAELIRNSGYTVLRCELIHDKIPVAFVVGRSS